MTGWSLKKLLVVDDDKNVLDLIQNYVAKTRKFRVLYAATFSEAALLLSEHDFFGAVCDLVLPDALNGEVVDLCTHEGIPTIVMTSSLNEEIRNNIIGRPILDYVYKNTKEDIISVISVMELLLFIQGQKVLIIDDSKLSRKNIHRIFTQLLFKTIEAENAVSGLECLKEHPDVKIIVVDYNMSGMKGDEIVQTIRNQFSHINAVIFGVTSNSSEKIRYSFLKKGAIDYFSLPLVKEEINAKTFTAMRLLQKVEELEKQTRIIENNIMTINIDLEGYITHVSQAYLDKTGYSKEELINKYFAKYSFAKDKNQAFLIWQTLQNNGSYNGELVSLKKNSSIFYENIHIEKVLNHHNSIVEYYGISQDITNNKYIEKLSITDSLSNLYNRRYFDTVIPNEIDRALRNEKRLGLIVLDIDYFKEYNDFYGHSAGDNVIMILGEMLQSFTKRASDFAFRIGGEEFAILVNDMKDSEILKLTEWMRRSLENKMIPHAKSEVSEYVTASLGVVNDVVTKETTLKSMYDMADKRLYIAKKSGRNCLCYT